MVNLYDDSQEYYQHFFNGRQLDPEKLASYRGTSFYADVQRYSTVLALVDSLCLPTSARVLDLGAGGGIMSVCLSSRFTVIDCCDIGETPDMQKARELYPSLRFREAVLPNLPYPDQSFDLIVFSEVIEHLLPSDQLMAVPEISRLLKPDGWCVLSTPNPCGINSILNRIAQQLMRTLGKPINLGDQLLENWLSPKKLMQILEKNFSITKRTGSFYMLPLTRRLPSIVATPLYDLSDWAAHVPALKALGLYQYYLLRNKPV